MNKPTESTHTSAHIQMRSIIQRIATGPELSKSISQEEAHAAMKHALNNEVDEVQAAIFFIALRLKRETMDEYKGMLDAIRAATHTLTAEVDELVDIADPYDGYNRSLPPTPFLPAVLAECGVPAITQGLDAVGPKFGVTHRHVLQALGVAVDLSPEQAAARISDPATGWSYIDQSQFCPKLHSLVPLRTKMVKRTSMTTLDVLAKPIAGRKKTHLVTGYVHKPYPPVYAQLARHVGYESALLIRGLEGGVMPSLRQEGKYYFYHHMDEEQGVDTNPLDLGIDQQVRSVPLPDDLPTASRPGDEIAITLDVPATAKAAAEAGMAALSGKQGPTYDGLVYSGALILHHVGKAPHLKEAAEMVRAVLDSGKATARIK
ncbi:MAG: anthranilate phosphoribosyltransferase [Gammaproteobacteria bacterium RIFOXYD12_FULL_61_37]|nr:MAG: anthranilate phosphoribosyltransferase [Gammaproteobacteria bacterium RIFOXYD12_FULL_61_37]